MMKLAVLLSLLGYLPSTASTEVPAILYIALVLWMQTELYFCSSFLSLYLASVDQLYNSVFFLIQF